MDSGHKLGEPSQGDRRNWRRYQVNWTFQIEGADRDGRAFWADGTLRDISARGLLGCCFNPPEAGTRVVVSIRVPFKGEKWFRYLAEIVRVESTPSGKFVALKFESSRPVFYAEDAKNKALLKKAEDNPVTPLSLVNPGEKLFAAGSHGLK